MGSLKQRVTRLEHLDGPRTFTNRTPEEEVERERRFDALWDELAELGVQRGEPREDPVADLLTMIENYRRNGDIHDDQDH